MALPILPIVIIGGVAYTLVEATSDEAESPPTTGPVRAPQRLADVQARLPSIIRTSGLMKRVNGFGIAATSPTNKTVDPELQKKLDAIEAAAAKAYEDMSDVAKVEAISTLNELAGYEVLPLDADLSWEVISGAIGGATGFAAGNYLCGPVCGKVGAMAGAYLATELKELIDQDMEELKDWLNKKVWGNIKDTAVDAYNKVEDAISGINPF